MNLFICLFVCLIYFKTRKLDVYNDWCILYVTTEITYYTYWNKSTRASENDQVQNYRTPVNAHSVQEEVGNPCKQDHTIKVEK
jgi:hypothetical protein